MISVHSERQRIPQQAEREARHPREQRLMRAERAVRSASPRATNSAATNATPTSRRADRPAQRLQAAARTPSKTIAPTSGNSQIAKSSG